MGENKYMVNLGHSGQTVYLSLTFEALNDTFEVQIFIRASLFYALPKTLYTI